MFDLNVQNIVFYGLLNNLIYIKLCLIVSFYFLNKNLEKRNNTLLSFNKQDDLTKITGYPKLVWLLLLIPFVGELWFFIMAFTQGKKLNLIDTIGYGKDSGITLSVRLHRLRMSVFALSCMIYNYSHCMFIFKEQLGLNASSWSFFLYVKFFSQCVLMFTGIWLIVSNLVLNNNLKDEWKYLTKLYKNPKPV